MTTPQPTQRIASVQKPIIPIVAQLIADNPGAISLGQGVVRYPPPPQALQFLNAGMADPQQNKYQPVTGIPALKKAITQKLANENNIHDNSGGANVVVTAGSNIAFNNAILAIADPGDEIIIQSPYYFNHEMALALANITAVTVPTTPDYQLDLPAIEAAITPRTRAIVTISPNNPTGAVYPQTDLTHINNLCRDHNLYHISDEAYEYFTYTDDTDSQDENSGAHFSPGSLPNASSHTISLFSLSKAFGFASYRIGYMTLPNHLLPAINKIQDTHLICPPVPSQHAALGCLEAGRAYCQPYLDELAHVRQHVLTELTSLAPLATLPTNPPPQGAFYALLKLNTRLTDMQIVEALIQDHKVAVIPGCAFGLTDAPYLRVAYGALDPQTVTEGIDRLTKGLREILTT